MQIWGFLIASLPHDGVERLDYPRPIPVRGRLAYLRKEPNTFSPPYVGSSETILGEIKDLQHDVGYFVCPVSEKKMLVPNMGT